MSERVGSMAGRLACHQVSGVEHTTMREVRPQLSQCPLGARAHGLDGNSEARGDAARREARQEAQLDHFAIHGSEFRQRLSKTLLNPPVHHELGCRRSGLPSGYQRLVMRSSSSGTMMIQHSRAQDLPKPSALIVDSSRSSLKCNHPGVLNGVVGVVRVRSESVGEAPHIAELSKRKVGHGVG